MTRRENLSEEEARGWDLAFDHFDNYIEMCIEERLAQQLEKREEELQLRNEQRLEELEANLRESIAAERSDGLVG